MTKKKTYQVPWVQTEAGPWVPFEGVRIGDEEIFMGQEGMCKIHWKPNEAFKACMKLHKLRANNYEPMIIMKDTQTDLEYRIESREFMRMVKTTALILGTVVGLWTFKKSGRYFYLQFEGPIPEEEDMNRKDSDSDISLS